MLSSDRIASDTRHIWIGQMKTLRGDRRIDDRFSRLPRTLYVLVVCSFVGRVLLIFRVVEYSPVFISSDLYRLLATDILL